MKFSKSVYDCVLWTISRNESNCHFRLTIVVRERHNIEIGIISKLLYDKQPLDHKKWSFREVVSKMVRIGKGKGNT